jgi:glutamate-1-semialdehyde aminotransferase
MFQQLLAKNERSRAHTDHHRPHFALNRNAAGFTEPTKELTYTLVCDRARGPYVYDIDGHEYIDLTMGFGSILFGHNYPPLREAIAAQLAQNWSVGPISPLAGELAEAITQVAPVERVGFFNSGTEAVMVAIRMAKAVTQKKYFVFFKTAYHGTFDPFLSMRSDRETNLAREMVPGVTQSTLNESYLLDYGTEESLAFIAEHGHEIAAVITEPVQSRRCDFHPRDYLHRLRGITEAHDIALIFDEVITGFRIALGGAQAYFGVQADIVTYGKVIGGGLPIGIVAGKRRFLDALDGGQWQFGDDSRPEAKATFVAGTFCHHPLAMAASLRLLELLRANGGQVLEDLNETTTAFCTRLNAFFEERGYPLAVANFGSLFRFKTPGRLSLLYYQLLQNGVYVWEGRNCFLSPAHDAAVLAELEARIQRSCAELEAQGILKVPVKN